MLLGQPPGGWSAFGIGGANSPHEMLDPSLWLINRVGPHWLEPYEVPPMPVSPIAATPLQMTAKMSRDSDATRYPSQPFGANRDHVKSPGSAGGNFGGQFVTLPDWARLGLRAISSAPLPIGTAASLANLGFRANNLVSTNRLRSALGLPELNLGQVLGGILGFNDYGSTNPNALRAEVDLGYGPTDVTVGGLYDRGGWFDSDLRTAFTPMEAVRRLNARTPGYYGHWGPSRSAPAGAGHGWGGAWGRSGGEGYGGPGGRGGLSADPTPGKVGR